MDQLIVRWGGLNNRNFLILSTAPKVAFFSSLPGLESDLQPLANYSFVRYISYGLFFASNILCDLVWLKLQPSKLTSR
jgi:accessory gene regulator protein AgrB